MLHLLRTMWSCALLSALRAWPLFRHAHTTSTRARALSASALCLRKAPLSAGALMSRVLRAPQLLKRGVSTFAQKWLGPKRAREESSSLRAPIVALLLMAARRKVRLVHRETRRGGSGLCRRWLPRRRLVRESRLLAKPLRRRHRGLPGQLLSHQLPSSVRLCHR